VVKYSYRSPYCTKWSPGLSTTDQAVTRDHARHCIWSSLAVIYPPHLFH